MPSGKPTVKWPFWVGGILVFAFIAYGSKDKTEKHTRPETQPKTLTAAPPPNETAHIQIRIEDLLESYQSNELAADNKYKDQQIAFAGIVEEIKKDALGKAYVVLGSGQQFQHPKVQALLAESEVGKAAELKKGQVIGISGHCAGLMFNVLVRDSRIVPVIQQ